MVVGGVGGGGSQRLLRLNPNTVLVVLFLELWLLLGCDNTAQDPSLISMICRDYQKLCTTKVRLPNLTSRNSQSAKKSRLKTSERGRKTVKEMQEEIERSSLNPIVCFFGKERQMKVDGSQGVGNSTKKIENF